MVNDIAEFAALALAVRFLALGLCCLCVLIITGVLGRPPFGAWRAFVFSFALGAFVVLVVYGVSNQLF